eukprot:GHVR01001717.1.p1 GENE.GHVR01001717.1~~GHVR01001717.1.p1  ORF type:complete len:129 (+),score=4.71 GHVR01001717.1:256-642(+)
MTESSSVSEVYKAVYINIMKREVTNLSKEKCYGCQIGHKSRAQHLTLSTGCFQYFLDLLETHGTHAFNFVKKSEIAALVRETGWEYYCNSYEQFPLDDCYEMMELLKRNPDLIKKNIFKNEKTWLFYI